MSNMTPHNSVGDKNDEKDELEKTQLRDYQAEGWVVIEPMVR